MHKIPVFYHIPKCGGNYVITKCTEILRSHNNKLVKLPVKHNGENVARIFLNNSTVEIDHFPSNDMVFSIGDILEKILFLTIEPAGIKFTKQILKNIDTAHHFSIFRHPFHRIQSLYNYIRSPESKHEPTHMSIKLESFEDYIFSKQFESNWICHNFGDGNYHKASQQLQHIHAYGMENIDVAISNCLLDCYPEIDINKFKHKNFIRNSCSKEKIRFKDMSYSARKTFVERSYQDIKLYKKILC